MTRIPAAKSWTVIGSCPSDGREWDAQCARCGSSVDWNDCDECGGEGYHERDNFDEDGDYWEDCWACDGHGGWNVCLSSADWCEENPSTGHADVPRGAIEWFTFDEPRGAK